jgi:branched-subunit amino acid transport protein AzlD
MVSLLLISFKIEYLTIYCLKDFNCTSEEKSFVAILAALCIKTVQSPDVMRLYQAISEFYSTDIL